MAPMMSWSAFYHLWNSVIAGYSIPDHAQQVNAYSDWLNPFMQIGHVLLGLFQKISLSNFLPILDLSHLAFTFGISTFFLFFLAFLWPCIRNNTFYLAISFYAFFTLIIFCYRDFAFHYYLIFFAVASLSVSFVLNQLLLLPSIGKISRQPFPALLLVFLLNINGLLIAIDSHSQRIIANKHALPIYFALARLSYGERVEISHVPQELGLFTQNWYNTGAPSRLLNELISLSH